MITWLYILQTYMRTVEWKMGRGAFARPSFVGLDRDFAQEIISKNDEVLPAHSDNESCIAYSSSMNVHRGYDAIGQLFTDHFKAAERSIFKLGVLQNYIGEDAGLSWRTWEAGKFDESMQLARNDPRYTSWMRLCHESPASITRAQVVERPLTPYAAWGLALFAEYQKQGAEKVYFTEAAHLLGKAALPDSDIVIFDDQCVLQWSYTPDSHGLVDGGTIWDAAEGDDISQFIALRQAVLDQAQSMHYSSS